MKRRKPVVALVGRPNVGKSTLFNRLIGARTAIVEDLPGTTRDRIYGESDWNGVGFIVIDTGGLEAPSELGAARLRQPGAEVLAVDSAPFVQHIQNQARVAIDEADAVIFVVAVNKTENQESQLNAVEFWNIGLGEPWPISGYHGDGVGDLLDELVKTLPAYPPDEAEDETIGITIVGRPNVGKSSLLNALLGTERAIVSDVPGTTRDPIDTQLQFEGKTITLIDTAGIRRRGSVEPGIEYLSVLRSLRSIDRSDVALLLIDATEGVTAQDAHVAGYILEKNKSVVIIVNKWDAVEKDNNTLNEFTRKVREDLKFLDYVPVLFISALTHQRVNKVLPTALEVVEQRRHRLGTSELNQVLHEAYDATPPTSRTGRRARLYYATQVSNDPPTFLIFVNDPELVHFSYERYLENQLRAHFPFNGTPIKLIFRERSSGKGE